MRIILNQEAEVSTSTACSSPSAAGSFFWSSAACAGFSGGTIRIIPLYAIYKRAFLKRGPWCPLPSHNHDSTPILHDPLLCPQIEACNLYPLKQQRNYSKPRSRTLNLNHMLAAMSCWLPAVVICSLCSIISRGELSSMKSILETGALVSITQP